MAESLSHLISQTACVQDCRRMTDSITQHMRCCCLCFAQHLAQLMQIGHEMR